jgi:hypothetical protein
MRALVVYESMFGNTRNVALAIAEGLGATMTVETVEVGAAPTVLPSDVDLLVVGGPTHAHGLSTPKSRADAAQRVGGSLVSAGRGLREWIASLRPGAGVVAAAFDTRIKGPMLFTGSAATSATKLLQKARVRRVEQPQSFVLEGATGPLVDRVSKEQLDAARAWGAGLASDVAAASG